MICSKFQTLRNVPGNSMKKSPVVTNAIRNLDIAFHGHAFARMPALEKAPEFRASSSHVCRGSSHDSPLSDCSAFQLHSTRKENVVFQVHMEVKVLLELFETLIGSLIARACVGRKPVSVARGADLPHQLARGVVLPHHGMDRIPHGLEERSLNWTAFACGAFQRVNKWEENLLLLLHVHQHFAGNIPKEFFDLAQFAVIAAMFFANFCEQRAKPRNRAANVLVVTLPDVLCQLSQGCASPLLLSRPNSFGIQAQLPQNVLS